MVDFLHTLSTLTLDSLRKALPPLQAWGYGDLNMFKTMYTVHSLRTSLTQGFLHSLYKVPPHPERSSEDQIKARHLWVQFLFLPLSSISLTISLLTLSSKGCYKNEVSKPLESTWHDAYLIKRQFLSLFSAHLRRDDCSREIRLIPEGSGVENASTLWPATEGRQRGPRWFVRWWLFCLCVSGAVSWKPQAEALLGQAAENLVHFGQMRSVWTQRPPCSLRTSAGCFR